VKILMFNQDWLQAELQEMGFDVISVSITNRRCNLFLSQPGVPYQEILNVLPSHFSPDAILYWDDSTVPWCPGFENAPVPKIFYSVDTHQHYRWHPQFAALFDKVFVAQKDYLNLFADFSPNCEWLSLWATRLPAAEQSARDLDVVFVGTIDPVLHPERKRFFDTVGEKVSLTITTGDYLVPYSRAKIVLNQVVNRDLNFRVFEALTSGALLLTPRIENGLPDLFTDGSDLVCYENGDPHDAIAKIQYYLQNESLRKQIAERGRSIARAQHTNNARAKKIADELRVIKIRKSPLKRYYSAFAYLAAYMTCRHQGLPWGWQVLEHAVSSVLQAESLASREQSATAVSLAQCLVEAGAAEAAEKMLMALTKTFPENITLRFALIRQLVTTGRRMEALAEAARLSETPERICMEVDALLVQHLSQD